MDNIIISNKKYFEEIKQKIILEGAEKFHVLADFDRTLGKASIKGKKSLGIIALLREKNYLGENYSKKAFELFNKYHPYEISNNISLQEKKDKMQEWWETHYEILKEEGLTRNILNNLINDLNFEFREGALEFFTLLNYKNIPLIIFSSSGIGNCIKKLFERENKFYHNIHIISNFIDFDNSGKMKGVKGKIIHPFNKDETVLRDFPEIYNEVKDRKNVLLLGDSLGDLGMIKGFDYENLLKIGFLNYDVEKNLEKYKENFDVVITNDYDMNFVNDFVKKIN